MKKFALMIAGLGIATAALPSAAVAAPWQNINQRQAQIDQRIDRGIRNGALSRREGTALRGEFRQIAQLENRYRRTGGGLSVQERRDLDQRMNRLSTRIKIERNDRNNRNGNRR